MSRDPKLWQRDRQGPPVQQMRTWVQVGDGGLVQAVHRGHGDAPASGGWAEVRSPECCLRLLQDPTRYTIDLSLDSDSKPVGRTRPKHVVHLCVDDPDFLADGVDCAVVMVLGLPETIEAAQVTVNGVLHEVPRVEDGQPGRLEIASSEPGLWQVRLVDPRLWADGGQLTIRGWPPTEENRRLYRPTAVEKYGTEEP